jgi:outer membrane protein
MKKILIILVYGAIFALVVNADMIRIEGAAGVWQQKSSGDVKYTDDSALLYGWDGRIEAKEEIENKGYAWIMIKHPIPVLPNLRVEYVNLESNGIATGTFKKYNVTATLGNTTLKMDQYDIIPYYNILDNIGWTTVDVGIDFKVVDASYEANGVETVIGNASFYKDSSTTLIPLLYVRSRVEFPYAIGVEGIAKYIGYGKSYVVDTIVKVDYTLEFVPVIQPAIEVGYRYQGYKYDDNDAEGTLDLTFSGFYAGVMLRY